MYIEVFSIAGIGDGVVLGIVHNSCTSALARSPKFSTESGIIADGCLCGSFMVYSCLCHSSTNFSTLVFVNSDEGCTPLSLEALIARWYLRFVVEYDRVGDSVVDGHVLLGDTCFEAVRSIVSDGVEPPRLCVTSSHDRTLYPFTNLLIWDGRYVATVQP